MRNATVVPILAAIALTTAAPLLAGCGINEGFKHDLASGDQHQYRMDLSGIRYARTVAGTASIGSILCLGFPWAGAWVPGIPLDHGLYKHAMEALHEDAKLKPNEVLKDLRTDHDPTCYLLLYGVNSLTVSADVYELTPAGVRAPAHREHRFQRIVNTNSAAS
jgi:hypothetical protein